MGPRNPRYTHTMVETPLSDEEIVALVVRGDSVRYGELMSRYETKLSRYGTRFLARTEDVGDIVQDVFVQAYQNLQSFDLNQRFSPWIYRIAHNAFANELRRRSRHPITLPDFDMLVHNVPAKEATDQESEHRMLSQMVEKGLHHVAPKYREVLILYFMEELAYREIADVLRIPVGTVGVRLARAKSALKTAYEKLNMTYD